MQGRRMPEVFIVHEPWHPTIRSQNLHDFLALSVNVKGKRKEKENNNEKKPAEHNAYSLFLVLSFFLSFFSLALWILLAVGSLLCLKHEARIATLLSEQRQGTMEHRFSSSIVRERYAASSFISRCVTLVLVSFLGVSKRQENLIVSKRRFTLR
ncbi:hypothetical protein K0M31_013911 [Melipona bicolor]|uniref:Uncharacterized protein n=1 Tax=Melipona bicolor TaxID=60889 RepID=A0AA40G7J3_9HYME|nr:hypothetical protein K0M31_013911 [Melipona bicolor]